MCYPMNANRRTNKRCIDCGVPITDYSNRCRHCASVKRMADNFPSIINTCKNCKNKFTVIKSRKNTAVFCSYECRINYGLVNCPVCDKKFKPSSRRGKTHCCSKKCAIEFQIKHPYQRNDKSKEFVCAKCGKSFKRLPSKSTRKLKFCSISCVNSYHKGQNHTSYTSVDCVCEICGTHFTREKSKIDKNGGKYCSKACFSQSQVKPGRTNYRDPNWKEQKRKARYRDKYKCTRCGISEIYNGRRLSVHHVIPFYKYGILHYKEANRLSNLTSLCARCHRIVETEHILTHHFYVWRIIVDKPRLMLPKVIRAVV